MESDQYMTLKGPSEGLYKEKGSRFIAKAIPISSALAAKTELEKLRREYHDARHHCYAYRIGEAPYETRINDDGEPSGTAGKPILGQIQSFGLTNVLVVVIRYFGGIKLGTGGLIQAYKTASQEALRNGTIENRTWTDRVAITFNFDQMDEVMHLIKEENLRHLSREFGEKCHIVLEIRKAKTMKIVKRLSVIENLSVDVI